MASTPMCTHVHVHPDTLTHTHKHNMDSASVSLKEILGAFSIVDLTVIS